MSDVDKNGDNDATGYDDEDFKNWADDPEGDEEGAEEQAAAPDEADEGDPEQQPEDDARSRTVPHQAMHAERVRRQQAEAEVQKMREQWARAEERMNTLAQVLQSVQEPDQRAPDPTQDPIGYMQHLEKQLAQLKGETEAQKAERERQEQAYRQQQEQAQALSQIDAAYKDAWTNKLSADPNTAEAYQAFVNAMDAHFQMRGVRDPGERSQLIQMEERAIAVAALQAGNDPAEAIISSAKFYGYRPTANAAQTDEKLQQRANGLKAARSLSNANGKAGGGMPSAAEIADMSAEEFDAFMGKLSPKQQRQIMGG